MPRRYWLLKTEPDVFSFEDLKNEPDSTSMWDGVRNYRARNTLRDDMKKGDWAFFYHSRVAPMAIVGICEVVREGYPDPTQFKPKEKYFDPKSPRDKPRWYCVDVKYKKAFKRPVTLHELKEHPELEAMPLLKKGMRLSVQSVEKEHWDFVCELAKQPADQT